jgi:diguanylate cyclase (GGDEF)-like protein
MSSTIEQKLLRSFLVGVLFALVIGAAAIWLQREDLVSQNNAALAQAVISADHDLLRSHLDAETGERGFVITGDPAYLAPYTAGIAAVQNSLDRLRAALPDTPADRATLQSLVLLSATEGADMAQAIAARKSYGFAAAQAAVETGAGKAAMDRIRVIDAQIGLVYRARIDQEAQSAARRFAWAFSFLLAFGLFVIALLIWAYLQIRRDLGERRKMSQSLAREASHDALTQMHNRRFFLDWLQYALAQASREQHHAAILFINLDAFKAVNEFFGYERGNNLLQVVASRLKAAARAADVLARMGGDEFAVLIPVLLDPAHPASLAQRLVETLALPFRENESLPTGASIGIAVYPADGDTPELLLAAADAAMRRAKAAGGNRYTFFVDAENAVQSRELMIRADLFQCVARDQLTVHYQPIVDARGRIYSLEALVRWDHPQLGRVSPQEFIPLAERSGAISKIDRYVRQTVIHQAAAWQAAGVLVPIAVNMSALEFAAGDLLESMLQDLRNYGLPAQFLTLELIETVLLKPETRETMQHLCDAGLNVVLDDFGTGFSSLSYLLHFPVNGVKIDRSFITGLPHHEDSRRLVSVILQMAATLSLSVVAEGVETLEQADWLAAHGCTRFQGYYFGRPMGVRAIGKQLQMQRVGVIQTI